MRKKEVNKMYFIKDEHFKQYEKYKLFYSPQTAAKGGRPHYLCIKKDKLCWVIPLSTRVNKYRQEEAKEIARYKKSMKFHFAKVKGVDNVFLIQNAFPVSIYNIDQEYLNGANALQEQGDIKTIERKLNNFISTMKQGVVFYKGQPDLISLEKEVIQEISDKEYIRDIKKENASLNTPFALNENILNSMLEYSNQNGEYKPLKKIAQEYKTNKTSSVKDPLLQSIGVFFETQQQNQIAPKEIVVKKEVAVSRDIER